MDFNMPSYTLPALLAAALLALPPTTRAQETLRIAFADPISSLDPQLNNNAGDRSVSLFFFDLLAQGIYLARRGMAALSLPVGEADCARYVAAVEEFVAARKPLLAAGAVPV
jgi:hypothetical protein